MFLFVILSVGFYQECLNNLLGVQGEFGEGRYFQNRESRGNKRICLKYTIPCIKWLNAIKDIFPKQIPNLGVWCHNSFEVLKLEKSQSICRGI